MSSSVGQRRRAREVALQILYQLDAQPGLSSAQGTSAFFNHLLHDASATGAPPPDDDAQRFATHLVEGVRANLEQIDQILTSVSRNWRLERMARVDRNLLRLAIFEMKIGRDVPGKVVINEAIEIAKRFGTAESPAFVNGILDRLLDEAE